MNTTEGLIYIINTITLERLEFQFIPLELGYERSASIDDVKIVGRNEPKLQTTGGKTTMPLDIDFYANETGKDDVMRSVKLVGDINNDGRIRTYTATGEIDLGQCL